MVIKHLTLKYFYNYRITQNDYTLDFNPKTSPEFHNLSENNNWKISFIDTGLETLKGARIKRIENYIKTSNFHLTYGDGLSNVNLNKLVKFHNKNNKIATVTAVRPPSRFGEMTINSKNIVKDFEEKSQMKTGYINGGFILNKQIMNHLDNNPNDFEFGPLQILAKKIN